MVTIAPRLGFPNARRLVKMSAIALAMVANQVSTEILQSAAEEAVEPPPADELLVGEFYYL